MPDYFLKKKSLLDRFKDNHGRTGYIQSARAEHTWSNPIKRNRRTKELNGWIKSFAGKKHIRKLARFNAQQAGRNESYENVKLDCLRYADILELPNGVCVKVNARIRCPRMAAFAFRITGIYDAGLENPSKYVIRGFYPVYGLERKPSEEFDVPCNDVSDIEQWIKSNETGNSMQNESLSLNGFIENLTEKLTKQFDLDLEEVQTYLDTHTPEMQELLNDTELSLKEKVLFVRDEITVEKDEANEPTSDNTLYIVQGVDAFTDFTYAFTQDELKHIKDHWSETEWRVKMVKLLFGADYEYELSENPDILDEVADSTEIGTKQELLELNYPEHLFEAKEPTDEKLSYEKGNKNSRGEDAPWVIRSHKNNRILASFATEKEAKEHLKRMKQYSKSESKQNEGLSNEKVKDAIKFAATEAGIENYLKVDSDGAMFVTVSLPINTDDLKTVRWVIDSNDGTITEYLDTEKNLVRDFTDDESLITMLTLLFQTSRMALRNWLPKKSEAVNMGGVKNMLRTYNAKGGSVKNGPWRICDGAYDLWFELYYNETPILGCTDNICKWYSNPETVGMTLDDYKKIEDAISSEIFSIDSFKMPESKQTEDLETYACFIDFETEADAKQGMEIVKGWHPDINGTAVVVSGLDEQSANHLWGDWKKKCTKAGLSVADEGEVYKEEPTCICGNESKKSETKEDKPVWGVTVEYTPVNGETRRTDVAPSCYTEEMAKEAAIARVTKDYGPLKNVKILRVDKLPEWAARNIRDLVRNNTAESMKIATEIDTMAGKHESKDVSLKEIARTLDTAINKDGNYSVKDNTFGVTATDKDRTQTIKVSKDLKVELEDKDGKHSYEAQSLRDLSKYIRRAVKGEYVNEDFHKTQIKDAVYDVINRHNLNNAVKVSYLGNSVVCKYADHTLRIQPDLLTTMSTTDGDNVDTYPTNLKELDGYLDRVFGHYADELVESKQYEGIKLKLVDTITVPQWLWEAYLLGNEYRGDLTDDEQTILYDFKEKYKDCHLDDRGEEPDFHSRNDFDCYGGNCYIVDVYTKTDVTEKKSEKLFNKQELESIATGADILDQLQYRFSFSFYSPKTYTDAVATALAMNAEGDRRIAHETIGDSEFRLYTDDPYDAIRFRDGLSNRAGIPAEDLANTFRSAVSLRKNGGFTTEDEQDTIGRYAAENYVSFSVSGDNSTMYVEGELPNVVEFFEAISSAEPT